MIFWYELNLKYQSQILRKIYIAYILICLIVGKVSNIKLWSTFGVQIETNIDVQCLPTSFIHGQILKL